MTTPLSRRDVWRAAGLALAAALVWLFASGAWDFEIRRTPHQYRLDGVESLARLQLAAEQGPRLLFDRHMDRLGAPFRADWSAYPISDVPTYLLLGILANVVGLAAASHAAVLLAQVLGTVVFFLCSRALGHRPIFAAGAGLLFGFSWVNVLRGFDHYAFALSFVAPGTLLATWLVGSGRATLERRTWQFALLALAVYAGTATPYFGLMFTMLLSIAVLHQFTTTRRRSNLVVGIGCLLAWAAAFVASNWHALGAMLFDERSVLVRAYSDVETFALRPVELFMPPGHHRIPAFADFASWYMRSVARRGENLSSYVGIVAAIGVVAVCCGFVIRLFRGGVGLRPAHAPTMLLVLLFAMVGGGAALLAFTVTDVFRATNRYSVYIVAASLFAMTAWASRRLRSTHRLAAVALTALVVALGIWDQVPPLQPAHWKPLFERVEIDRRVGAVLEDRLPPEAMVFQVPVRPFLEQPSIGAMTDYEEFRLFLFAPTIRFSYGHLAGDPRLAWARRMERLPATDLKNELERAGFAAIHVYTTAYPDRASALRAEYVAAGMQVLHEEGPHLLLRLAPSDRPEVPPLTGANRYEPYDPTAPGTQRLVSLVGNGWYPPERNGNDRWRWAKDGADTVLWNPTGTGRETRLQFLLEGYDGDVVVTAANGAELWRARAMRGPRPHGFPVSMPPGETLLHWRFFGRPGFAGPEDNRRLGFRLVNLDVELR